MGFVTGEVISSRSNILKQLETVLKNEDEEALSKLLDSDMDLTSIIKFYCKDTLRVDATIIKLKKNGETFDFKLVSKDAIFGKKYHLELKTYNLNIKSNFKDAEFKISDKGITTKGTFEKIVPGEYEIEGIINSVYGKIEQTKEISITEDLEEEIKFNAINIKVESEFPDAQIYVDDIYTGNLVKDSKIIGPLVSDKSRKIHLERDFPWGRLKGEEVKVKDIQNIKLSINMENEKLKNDISQCVEEFYKNVFLALNTEKKESIEPSTKEVKEKIYNILSSNYFILKNKYEPENIEIRVENNRYEYKDGEYIATVAASVKYKTSKILGIFPKDNEKEFFTKLIYKKGNWIVNQVENFSL